MTRARTRIAGLHPEPPPAERARRRRTAWVAGAAAVALAGVTVLLVAVLGAGGTDVAASPTSEPTTSSDAPPTNVVGSWRGTADDGRPVTAVVRAEPASGTIMVVDRPESGCRYTGQVVGSTASSITVTAAGDSPTCVPSSTVRLVTSSPGVLDYFLTSSCSPTCGADEHASMTRD